jgi:hypothetical protein
LKHLIRHITLPAIIIFGGLSLIGILNHEIWLDEAQHFLIGRDSRGVMDMLRACRNEGHPLLWNILLFVITRFTPDPFYMQLVHILIGSAVALIILLSEGRTVEKILIIFGYFFFFEYNLISRNYGISALLMLLPVWLYTRGRPTPVKVAVLLFLLAQTHLFSLIFSIAFVISLILTDRHFFTRNGRFQVGVAAVIILAGWVISLLSILPPWHYGVAFLRYDPSGFLSGERIMKTLSVCLKGIFYIPDYNAGGHQFINTIYLTSPGMKGWTVLLFSLAAMILPAWILKRSRMALILYCIYLSLFLPLCFFLPLVYGIRYFGFLWLLFVCCFFIARTKLSRPALVISYMLFVLHCTNGIFAYAMDLRYPFSEGKAVSGFLEKVNTGDEPVLILNPVLRPAISVYTGKKYFGTENGQQLSYCLWGEKLPDTVLRAKLDSLLNASPSTLIVTNNPINGILDSTRLQLIGSFRNGIFKGENADIFRYMRRPSL